MSVEFQKSDLEQNKLKAGLGYFIFFLPLILVTIVGDLFVSAYMEAAQAAFYREVSGTESMANTIYVNAEDEQ